MKKQKIKYVCSHCGFETLRWLGKCPDCSNWNTLIEEIIETGQHKFTQTQTAVKVQKISEVSSEKEIRLKTGIGEFDRVLGGGIVLGSVVLIGGDPGIGKSTLVLQAASTIKAKVLYVSGEESASQLKMRATRLKVKSDNILILPETDLNTIFSAIKNENPQVVIIDSIQTIHNSNLDNSAGSVTQIRECTSLLLEDAKRFNYSVIIVGHVTKEGIIAGPKVLEHIVDTVIQFEGDSNHSYRILRAQKNRFGSTNEIGIFEMSEAGLFEVKNPSEIFLSERDKNIPGSVVTASMEGTRPILLEIQALVTPSNFGNPQRVTTGFDYRRLSILLAVLEKRGNFRLSSANVYLNIAGGVKLVEPAVDLAICCSAVSSLLNQVADNSTVVIGEVGLGGEVRSVGNIEKRIHEAEKLGFRRVIVPNNNMKGLKENSRIKIIPVENISEAVHLVLR